jgi:predicted acetyltransferase
LQRIKDRKDRTKLEEGRVPMSEFWLVDGNKFIGWVKIRHELNKELLKQGGHIGYAIRPSERKKGNGTKILKLALIFAKQLGLSRVLVTCDDDNLGSAKIIENNGGVLENTIENEGKLKRRYWIDIK